VFSIAFESKLKNCIFFVKCVIDFFSPVLLAGMIGVSSRPNGTQEEKGWSHSIP